MASPGRKPTPVERKRLLGNPGRRPLPDRTKVVALPTPEGPPEPHRVLGTHGRKLWDSAWEYGAVWLFHTDHELLLTACELLDERVRLRVQVMQVGDWRERLALRQLDDRFLEALSMLGFTPTDRARMGVAEVTKNVSKLDQFRRVSR